MTNNLTPEIADGWRHISEIVNEPDDGIVQTASFRIRHVYSRRVFFLFGLRVCGLRECRVSFGV